jgi:DNA-binding transcriptional LysR family regulator
MYLPQLQYFKVVAETQNYTKAAQKLSVSQPALSRTITNLEEELGIELFFKKGRGVELSVYGKIFLEHVNIALDSIFTAERKIKTLVSPKTGHIRLASIYTLGVNFVPFVIKDFNIENPLVTFSFSQQPTRIVLRMLRDRDIDLCFCTDFEGLDDINEFEKMTILIEDLYILVNKKHKLANRSEVSLSELKNEKWIFFNDDTYFKRTALHIFEQAGFYPNILYECNEDSAVAGFVAADMGIALIPPIIGVDYSKTVPLQITYPICQRTLCMAWRKQRYATPIIEKFREYVLKWLPESKKLAKDHYN